MQISDEQLAQVYDQGFTVVENFIPQELLKPAQDALWDIYPRPEEYFANPEAHRSLVKHQFAGLRFFPYPSWHLNRLAVLPELVDAAERFCGTDDIEIYKVELWAKYSGAVDYDQAHHRDYGNHTIVVPKNASSHVQMTCFILLSDVTEQDGPTKVIPAPIGKDIPLVPRELPMGAMTDKELSITGKAGTLFIYKTDILHRGSSMTGTNRSRFIMPVDFQKRGLPWTGKMSWPNYSLSQHWHEAMANMTPRERCLFGFPAPGDEYWDEQTIRDVGLRYPEMDMSPYAAG